MRRKFKSKADKKDNRGAVKIEIDGIKFRSKLEGYCYLKLKENNIEAGYETVTFTLLKGFTFDGKKIQPMTYTPDFVGKEFIIECKGFPNDAFPLRWKLFKYMLVETKSNYDVYLPHSHKEVDKAIETILNKRYVTAEEKKRVRTKRYKQFFPFLV